MQANGIAIQTVEDLVKEFKNNIDFTIEFICANNPVAVIQNMRAEGLKADNASEAAAVLRALYRYKHLAVVGKMIAVPFDVERVNPQVRDAVKLALSQVNNNQAN